MIRNYNSILLENVWPEDSGESSYAPALLLKRHHTGQKSAEEAEQAVIDLRQLLKEVLDVSAQLFLTAVV